MGFQSFECFCILASIGLLFITFEHVALPCILVVSPLNIVVRVLDGWSCPPCVGLIRPRPRPPPRPPPALCCPMVLTVATLELILVRLLQSVSNSLCLIRFVRFASFAIGALRFCALATSSFRCQLSTTLASVLCGSRWQVFLSRWCCCPTVWSSLQGA